MRGSEILRTKMPTSELRISGVRCRCRLAPTLANTREEEVITCGNWRGKDDSGRSLFAFRRRRRTRKQFSPVLLAGRRRGGGGTVYLESGGGG